VELPVLRSSYVKPIRRVLGVSALGLLLGCSPFTGNDDIDELSSLLIIGAVLDVTGGCAFSYQAAANDYDAQIFPIPTSGCNQQFYFGATYQDYLRKQRNRAIMAEAYMQSNAPADCTTTISTFQGFISNPSTNTFALAQASIQSDPRYTVVDMPLESAGRTNQNIQGQGISPADAAQIASQATAPSFLDYESHIYLVQMMNSASSEPSCQNALASPVNALIPDWMADQRIDPVVISSGLPTTYAPRLYFNRCRFGSANSGNLNFCATLRQ
jgi:hypothetical protein